MGAVSQSTQRRQTTRITNSRSYSIMTAVERIGFMIEANRFTLFAVTGRTLKQRLRQSARQIRYEFQHFKEKNDGKTA